MDTEFQGENLPEDAQRFLLPAQESEPDSSELVQRVLVMSGTQEENEILTPLLLESIPGCGCQTPHSVLHPPPSLRTAPDGQQILFPCDPEAEKFH